MYARKSTKRMGLEGQIGSREDETFAEMILPDGNILEAEAPTISDIPMQLMFFGCAVVYDPCEDPSLVTKT